MENRVGLNLLYAQVSSELPAEMTWGFTLC